MRSRKKKKKPLHWISTSWEHNKYVETVMNVWVRLIRIVKWRYTVKYHRQLFVRDTFLMTCSFFITCQKVEKLRKKNCCTYNDYKNLGNQKFQSDSKIKISQQGIKSEVKLEIYTYLFNSSSTYLIHNWGISIWSESVRVG